MTIQKQILELIDSLRRRLGMSVILVTHDLGVIAGTADRVAVMYAGRIVETGTTAALFANPRHPYTEALFEALPERAAVVAEGSVWSAGGPGGGFTTFRATAGPYLPAAWVQVRAQVPVCAGGMQANGATTNGRGRLACVPLLLSRRAGRRS